MFQKDGSSAFPVLKGKAGEIRHVAPALLFAFTSFVAEELPEIKLMQLFLHQAVSLESMLDENASIYRLPGQTQARFEQTMLSFVQINVSLGRIFHPRGQRLFNHTIKHHFMCHLAHISRRINPHLGWCYAGEGFMHRVKLIMQSSQRGAAAGVVVPKAMLKYAAGLGLSLHNSVWRA